MHNAKKGQPLMVAIHHNSDFKAKKFTASYKTHTEVEMVYTEGTRSYTFKFRDGVMTGTETNMPYEKTLSDWQFFAKAIEAMLKRAKKLGYNYTPISGIETDIPF